MSDPSCAHRLDPAEVRELRHMAGLGGWVFADYFSGNFEPIGRALLAAGYIKPGELDGAAIYETTEAGRAYLTEWESR
jgi:hypothetical protein